MNAHSIRHAWFPPAIPKRKHDNREFDSESEWPSTYRPLSEPTLESRPTKRLRQLEGDLAELTLRARNPLSEEPITINTDPEALSPPYSHPRAHSNQTHDVPLDGEAEPYISSIYEFASPHIGSRSSVASLPLQGEVSEVNTSDEEYEMKEDVEGQQMNGSRIGGGVFVRGEEGVPGYTVYEPENGPEKRKRKVEDDEHGLNKRGKRSWYEPEKDRECFVSLATYTSYSCARVGVVVLDLDSSEDESVTRSPRRRRSAFSLTAASQKSSSSRSRSQTETREDTPEFVINPKLLLHISSKTSVPSIPREENSTQAVILYKPAPWITEPHEGEPEVTDIENIVPESSIPMEASPLVQDDDAMDIDS
ncbi:hypothetical protein RHS04_05686 [Rhizoctonia solani]|uniref:Uncharacterized protein n=1 Tax=Rhizoctonia solani TaxID=456999 RepID=A0A8H7H722_9AGAM|nr:hypothetical protein RHS04_05686 [Rhizoctonia solani]